MRRHRKPITLPPFAFVKTAFFGNIDKLLALTTSTPTEIDISNPPTKRLRTLDRLRNTCKRDKHHLLIPYDGP
jgi:hypothetical protein